MSTSAEDIQSVAVAGTSEDIAAAAEAIMASGGTVVSVQAVASEDGTVRSGQIDYVAGDASDG